jgi:hypothetical protein
MMLGLARLRLAFWAQGSRRTFWRLQGELRMVAVGVFLGVKRLVVLPLLRAVNKMITIIAGLLPDDRLRIDTSGLLRAGTLQWLGVKSFSDRHMPALSAFAQKFARWFLSTFDEGQLQGMMSMCATELIAREVQRQIEPLPPDVQEKAVVLSERVLHQLETKLVEFGQVKILKSRL